jgi:hypothetical protein
LSRGASGYRTSRGDDMIDEEEPMSTTATFAVEEYRDELEAAPTNYQIATTLLFENERLRVWEMLLGPGERISFHCHRTPYF